ncbi:murein transglycosylase A [Arenibaculum pallidiluteum]|uniref:murein transglycosylase A n=1 Tax=Arenibaculum pallidiluteum TaxID=2812559 RepID=UPI001A96AA2E|nr:MltA domain-containing protein [Arenibaculum pallidiluteum]
MRAFRAALPALSLALLAAACAPREAEKPPAPEPRLALAPAAFSDLPGWDADALDEALPALARSCAKLMALPPDRGLGVAGKAGDWAGPCGALPSVPPGDRAAARGFIEAWFRPWSAGDGSAGDGSASDGNGREGLFTGYYEPELRGSTRPDARYRTALLRRPPDLVMVDLGEFRPALRGERIAGRVVGGRLRPFEDRGAIASGALDGKGLELVWVDDAVDAFFLHIQGSGRVVLEDGSVLRVGYDGQNGHPYVAVGRELVARGVLTREQVSLQSIRAWMRANPGQAQSLMDLNPSYVFFRKLAGEGPEGAQGVELTPRRSIAVDPRFIPYGVPVWLEAEDPLGAPAPLRRLMVAQDTGGAIRGPVRGDVFWGHGADAEERAGRMRSRGVWWLLLPRGVAPDLGASAPAR